MRFISLYGYLLILATTMIVANEPQFFKFGATQGEVIHVMGQPTSQTRWSYFYGTSRIDFNPSVPVPVVSGYQLGDTLLPIAGEGIMERQRGIITLINGDTKIGDDIILSSDPVIRRQQLKQYIQDLDVKIKKIEANSDNDWLDKIGSALWSF